MLMKAAVQSLTGQLAARFAERIKSQLLAPGARLPSVRLCAQQQAVSVSTVVAAYDQLQAQGLVVARKNSGFYVRDARVPGAQSNRAADHIIRARADTKNIAEEPDVAARPIDATALLRGMYELGGNRPQPGIGVFPPDWLDTPFLATAVRKFTTSAALKETSLSYGDPRGDSALRQAEFL